MTDGQVADQARHFVVVEHLSHQAHVLDHHQRGAIAHRHARRLLAPVLEGVEAVEHDGGDAAPGSEYPEHPTGFFGARVLNRTAHLSILARAEQLSRTGGVNVVAR